MSDRSWQAHHRELRGPKPPWTYYVPDNLKGVPLWLFIWTVGSIIGVIWWRFFFRPRLRRAARRIIERKELKERLAKYGWGKP